MNLPQKILVCAAHPDDTEIGCGGSLTRYKDAERFALVFCDKNPNVDPPGLVGIECHEGMERLGMKHSIYDFPMRRLDAFRYEILQIMFDYRDRIKPDIVFIPSPCDLHFDHYTVAREAMRAFKGVTTFAYEMPWNNITFKTQAFIKLESHHVYTKIYAMEAYKSQQHKPYFDKNFVYCLAKTRGVSAGCELAEAFEVIRWVS